MKINSNAGFSLIVALLFLLQEPPKELNLASFAQVPPASGQWQRKKRQRPFLLQILRFNQNSSLLTSFVLYPTVNRSSILSVRVNFALEHGRSTMIYAMFVTQTSGNGWSLFICHYPSYRQINKNATSMTLHFPSNSQNMIHIIVSYSHRNWNYNIVTEVHIA